LAQNIVDADPWFLNDPLWDDLGVTFPSEYPSLSEVLDDEFLPTDDVDGTETGVLVAPDNVGNGGNAPRPDVPLEGGGVAVAPAGTIDPRVLGNRPA
jgi:hypothetical protein